MSRQAAVPISARFRICRDAPDQREGASQHRTDGCARGSLSSKWAEIHRPERARRRDDRIGQRSPTATARRSNRAEIAPPSLTRTTTAPRRPLPPPARRGSPPAPLRCARTTPRATHSISPRAPSPPYPPRRFAPALAPPPPDAPGPPRARLRPRAGPRRPWGPPQALAVATARLVLVPRAAPPRARPGAARPPGPPRSALPGPPSGSATRRGRGRRRRAGRDREGGRGSFARLRPAHRAGLRPAGLLAGAEYLLRQGAVLLHIRDHDVAREDAAGALRGALRHRQAVAAAHQEVGHRHRIRARRAGGLAGVPGAARRLAERSEEHTSELQSLAYLVCRLLLEK